MNRGEIWLAEVGKKRRPVLVLTRSEVLTARTLVTVAEITTSMRGLAAEVPLDHGRLGLDRDSAVNCDGLHTVPQKMLTRFVADVGPQTMDRVCDALTYAVGC